MNGIDAVLDPNVIVTVPERSSFAGFPATVSKAVVAPAGTAIKGETLRAGEELLATSCTFGGAGPDKLTVQVEVPGSIRKDGAQLMPVNAGIGNAGVVGPELVAPGADPEMAPGGPGLWTEMLPAVPLIGTEFPLGSEAISFET